MLQPSGRVFATAHTSINAGGTLSPGAHTITFEGTDGESTVSDTVGIVVNADPVNLPPRDVEIHDPDSGDAWPSAIDIGLVDENDAMGDFKRFNLCGRATDPEFGNFTGTSLEWTITSPTGTSVPASGTGTVLPVKLYVDSGQSAATFTVTLTAIDTDDDTLRTSKSMLITVRTLI